MESTEFDQLVAQGLAESQADRSEAALRLFAKASELDPSSGIPHFLIASEHASVGDAGAAELAFSRAALLAPGFFLARYQLGLLQFSSRRVPVALLTWEPLLALPDGDPLPHFVRGFVALAQDAFPEALREFRAGVACEPANPAVCADVLQVIDAVERLGRRSEDAEAGTEHHVLLSGYAKGLH